ncbi:MAG TPA: sigma-70 family RNA polymerase sigma factor [Anaerohalosphaeraceae bacterium]|nr:sigma-70 family RNA polymerase sigma factor [Anaerohalosphaeraceae bacterium]
MSDINIQAEDVKDPKARQFMSILVPNQRRILAFILSMVPNKQYTEDILQETLAEMWTKFEQFEIGTDFAAWGCTIAKYKVIEFRRKAKNSRLQFNDSLMRILENESDQKLKKMSCYIDALQQCIQKLTLKEVGFLKQRYEEDLTLTKIASRTGISFQGVHKAISIIHSKLVRCIRANLRLEETV